MNTPEGSATARRGGILELNAAILAAASVVGGKEREGPLGGYFDFVNPGDRFGQDTWESAESEMQRMALASVLGKAHRSEQDVDLLLAATCSINVPAPPTDCCLTASHTLGCMVPAPPRQKDFCWRLHWSARALPPVPES